MILRSTLTQVAQTNRTLGGMFVVSRRDFLRLFGSIAFGLAMIIFSNALIGTEPVKKNTNGLADSLLNSNNTENSWSSLITVKVYYSLMAQYVNVSEENAALQSPATLQDLVATCMLRHPAIGQMAATMMILLDGEPSKPSASLQDGDTVQFIPLSAGG